MGRLRRPRQPSWADAWPTGKPTSRDADAEGVDLPHLQRPARRAGGRARRAANPMAAASEAPVHEHAAVAVGQPQGEEHGGRHQVDERRGCGAS